MNVVVYTAIFGGYTQLRQPRNCGAYRIHCFTDAPLTSNSWAEIDQVRNVFKTPRLDAKYYKMKPHVAFLHADVTIWIDGSFEIGDMDAFVSECLMRLPKGGIALYRHPERFDIYAEAAASRSVWHEKYRGEPLEEQVAHYRSLGLPAHHGLWAGGILARDNRAPVVQELNRRWLYECVRWSVQDQLSLPFVLWDMAREGFSVPLNEIPGSVYQGAHHCWFRGPDR